MQERKVFGGRWRTSSVVKSAKSGLTDGSYLSLCIQSCNFLRVNWNPSASRVSNQHLLVLVVLVRIAVLAEELVLVRRRVVRSEGAARHLNARLPSPPERSPAGRG